MKPEILSTDGNVLHIGNSGDFSVFKTFDCGQCFRFDRVRNSDYAVEFSGIARSKKIGFAQNSIGDFYILGAAPEDFPVWSDYLALDVDYGKINENIVKNIENPNDRRVAESARDASLGIRILRQDRWETLCSFIISQNNNIPRIKKIISSLCEKYGADIGEAKDFPTPDALYKAGENSLRELKCGFRAKYIYSAAAAVSNGELSLENVAKAKSLTDGEKLLTALVGVGPKVAACTLLFGFERYDAFPVDVWIKRVLKKRFSKDFDPLSFGSTAGIAQQYLFYSERYLEGSK